MLIAFGLAVVLVFLILAAQYESFRDPVIMLVSVPMSLAGALLFFALGVVSANIYTQIGLLALIGSIIRHGILLVEFANDIQVGESCDRRQAMEKAASLRLRSILMTTVATLISMVPLLLSGSGPGANSRFAISFVRVSAWRSARCSRCLLFPRCTRWWRLNAASAKGSRSPPEVSTRLAAGHPASARHARFIE